jgi:glutathione S-transferase
MPPRDASLNRDLFYRFYAADCSYFSAKVRPALRYKRIPYVELLPTPAAYRTVIVPRTGLAFIPVVLTADDETLQDTSDILDALERRFPEPPLYPRPAVLRVLAYLIELYADEFLLLPALHYRWSFPESAVKARADFAASTGDVGSANTFADRISGALPFMGIVPDSIPAIEAHTHDLLDRLSAHLARHPYLLGRRPSLADCALMGPLYAHLYLDAVPARLLRERAPLVCHWIQRMNNPDPDAFGDWVAPPALAPTLAPLLALIGADAIPLLLDNLRAVDAWAASRPPDVVEPPRGVGGHGTSLRGIAVPRVTSPYTLWMAQRPLDVYTGLAPTERAEVDRFLAGSGCEALFAYRPGHRLGKRRFKLVFEEMSATID